MPAGGISGNAVDDLPLRARRRHSCNSCIGLGLALLCAQPIAARNLFRVIFFIPLMVTPVGVAYMFRMLADMQKGPFAPLERGARPQRMVLGDTSLVGAPDGADRRHLAVDAVHVHRAARRDREPAARPARGGAARRGERFQIFRDITWPAIAPIAATVVLIRLIEAFKIIDMPNVLTAGGPGLATESMTLHSFIAWRTQDLGGSAAVGYLLLFVSTITCVSFFNYVVRWTRRYQ